MQSQLSEPPEVTFQKLLSLRFKDLNITKVVGIAVPGRFATAELFAGLAILTLGCILTEPSSVTVLYQPLTLTTFFPHPKQLQIGIAALSAISALTYYGLARCSLPSNKFLGFAQFVLLAIAALLTTIAIISFAPVLSHRNHQNATIYIVWHPSLLAMAWPSFALGCVVYLVNVCIAAIKHFGQ